jgi:hypothetical protein
MQVTPEQQAEHMVGDLQAVDEHSADGAQDATWQQICLMFRTLCWISWLLTLCWSLWWSLFSWFLTQCWSLFSWISTLWWNLFRLMLFLNLSRV